MAWALTVPVAAVCWAFYISSKEGPEQKSPHSFWLIVGIPLLVVYALRFPFPDTSFDVWSLRLFHAERALHGYLYRPSEFFPTSAPFNPAPDMITGIFRHLLGYRLGTVINLLALLWAASVVEKILRPVIKAPGLRACSVLLIMFVEHLLFEVNNYMPDLLALPVLLEATRLTLEQESTIRARQVGRVAFLIGVAVALKLSNGAVALPLVLIWIWRVLRSGSIRSIAAATIYSLLVTIPLLLPFTIWVYKLTGSPIFPLYNGIFHSPFYPPFNGWDDRWGGFGPLEILFWPILIFFHPQRTAEISVYSGRLSIGFIAAVVCLVFARKLPARLTQLAFTLFLGTLLWSITMGYIRYGLMLEALSGVLLVMVASALFERMATPIIRQVLVVAVAVVLAGQSLLAASYVLRMEWSMRPTVFNDFKTYRNQIKNVLGDYSLRTTLPAHEQTLFDQVNVWIVSGSKTAGPMILLNEKPPFIGVRSAGLFLAPETREVFKSKLGAFGGQQLSSLALYEDFPDAVYALRQAGLGVGHIENVTIPFFSKRDDLVQAAFFEVTKDYLEQTLPHRSIATTALAETSNRAIINAINPPAKLRPGEIVDLYLRVKNEGAATWPSLSGPQQKHRIELVGRWVSNTQPPGTEVTTRLPYDLPPEESVVVLMRFRAPARAGDYRLELRLRQEAEGQFVAFGTCEAAVKVE